MADATVAAAPDGPVLRLTITNPAQAGALTPAMLDELTGHVEAANADPDVRVVVLRGADGTFSSGYALSSFPTPDELQEDDELTAAGEALARCSKATIAVLEGNAVGAGLDLALAADLRLADPRLRTGITPSRFGIVYPWQGIARLVDRVGEQVARRMLLTAEVVDAAAAHALGLVDEIAEADQGIDALEARWVGRLLRVAPLSVAGTKEVLDRLAAPRRPSDDDRAHILALRRAALGSADAAEAMTAFREKRPALFRGR